MRFALICALVLFSAAGAQAQNTHDPKSWSLDLLQQIAANPDLAIQRIREETYLGQNINQAKLEQVRQSIKDAARVHGIAVEPELIGVRTLGQSNVEVLAFLRQRKGSTFYALGFYHLPDAGWNLMSLQVKADFGGFPWQSAPIK